MTGAGPTGSWSWSAPAPRSARPGSAAAVLAAAARRGLRGRGPQTGAVVTTRTSPAPPTPSCWPPPPAKPRTWSARRAGWFPVPMAPPDGGRRARPGRSRGWPRSWPAWPGGVGLGLVEAAGGAALTDRRRRRRRSTSWPRLAPDAVCWWPTPGWARSTRSACAVDVLGGAASAHGRGPEPLRRQRRPAPAQPGLAGGPRRPRRGRRPRGAGGALGPLRGRSARLRQGDGRHPHVEAVEQALVVRGARVVRWSAACRRGRCCWPRRAGRVPGARRSSACARRTAALPRPAS